MMLHLTQLGHHVLNVEKPLNDFQNDYAGHFHNLTQDFEILSANKVFVSTLNTNPVKGSILDQSMIKLINCLTEIFYFFILLICTYCFIVSKTKIIIFLIYKIISKNLSHVLVFYNFFLVVYFFFYNYFQ